MIQSTPRLIRWRHQGPALKLSAPALHRQSVLYLLDRLLGGLLLLCAMPVICVLAAIVAWKSRQSPFVAHLRAGRFGVPFWMLKLRTMWEPGNAISTPWLVARVEGPVPECKEAGDPRVRDPFARFCRRYSLDELPQLVHVVLGQMALVGPRPITQAEMVRYYGANAAEVLQAKPGLSGLWQVRGRNKLTYRQRCRLDLFLVRHLTPALYLRILLDTFPRVVAGQNAW